MRGEYVRPSCTALRRPFDPLSLPTNDAYIQQAALDAGALHAGGNALVNQVLQGEGSVESVDRALASSDMMPTPSNKVARLLGPRGLMHNAKVGTLVPMEELLQALDTQLTGMELQFRTEKEGIVHLPVGKSSFRKDKLLDNIGQVIKTTFENKPESFGKGKKFGLSAKVPGTCCERAFARRTSALVLESGTGKW